MGRVGPAHWQLARPHARTRVPNFVETKRTASRRSRLPLHVAFSPNLSSSLFPQLAMREREGNWWGDAACGGWSSPSWEAPPSVLPSLRRHGSPVAATGGRPRSPPPPPLRRGLLRGGQDRPAWRWAKFFLQFFFQIFHSVSSLSIDDIHGLDSERCGFLTVCLLCFSCCSERDVWEHEQTVWIVGLESERRWSVWWWRRVERDRMQRFICHRDVIHCSTFYLWDSWFACFFSLKKDGWTGALLKNFSLFHTRCSLQFANRVAFA